MSKLLEECSRLSDTELIAQLKAAATSERRALASLLALLSEFDARRLSGQTLYASVFTYCTRELGYSEDAAYKRMQAARVVRRYPAALDLLEAGRLHLAALVLLSPHLTDENHGDLLAKVEGRSKREIEIMLAGFMPQAPRADIVRHFVLKATPGTSETDNPENLFSPRAREKADNESMPPQAESRSEPSEESDSDHPHDRRRVRISFDADFEVWSKLEKVRQILSNKHPSGRICDVVSEALEALLDRIDPGRRFQRRLARRQRKMSGSGTSGPAERTCS